MRGATRMSERRGSPPEGRAADSRLDLAIDRAVREMLDIDPPARLRGRVLERLNRPGRGSGLSRKILWTAVPLAAAAVLIVAVAASWLTPKPSSMTPRVATAERPAALPAQPVQSTNRASAQMTSPKIRGTATFRSAASKVRPPGIVASIAPPAEAGSYAVA